MRVAGRCGSILSKMTSRSPKWPENAQKTPKMAPNGQEWPIWSVFTFAWEAGSAQGRCPTTAKAVTARLLADGLV